MCRPAHTLWLMLFLLGSAGCVATRTSSLSSSMRAHPERYIVVTVANDPHTPQLNAASSSRGYDYPAPYTIGAKARRLARAIAANHDLSEAAAWPIAALGIHCLVYRMEDNADRAEVLDALSRDARVESAQALETFTAQSTDASASYNDPYAALQRNLMQLDVPDAQRYSRGEGVKIAIIDTGIDVNHPDLRERVFAERNFVDHDREQFHRDVHGTAVAGVIAAVANNGEGIVGIAPAAKLLALKACWAATSDSAAKCNSFTLAQALAEAIDTRVDIVNLSLAGPSDPLLTRLVKEGMKRGIIFVCAAPPPSLPAGFPNEIDSVLTVVSSEEREASTKWLTAPGAELFTLAPAGHYDVVSGHSFAAAEISGVVALLLARRPHLSADETHAALMRNTQTAINENPSINVDACLSLATFDTRVQCKPYFEARSGLSH